MNTFNLTVLSLALSTALIPSAVRADLTAFLGASKDNTIFENFPNNSGGGAAGIFSGATNTLSKRRGLIAFDIAASVPAGATITSVELSMYLANAPNANNQTIGLHRLTLDWGENTTDTTSPLISMAGNGVAALAGDATWNENFFGTTSWPTAGATGSFSGAASATAVISGPIDNQQKWLSTAALISDVQSWLDSPATNYGWAIVNANETTAQTVKAFYSRQATLNGGGFGTDIDPTWRPTVTVNYVPAGPSGDYNGNNFVDAADYVIWRQTFNSPAEPAGSGADGNENNLIDDGDHTYWKARFGNPVDAFQSPAAIPEPATCVLLLAAVPLAFCRGRR